MRQSLLKYRNLDRMQTRSLHKIRILTRKLIFLTGILCTQSILAQQINEEQLETIQVAMEQAPKERLFDGTVEAVNKSTVSAQTSGRIAEIFYDVDDKVKAGSPIIRFTDVEQQAGLRQAQAQLQEAKARKKEADEEFRRASDLYNKGSGTKREYDRALAAREAAGARVSSAQSAIKTAQQQVDYTLVTAPYSGIVAERHVELGEFVSVGQPLMSGLSLGLLRVTVDLPQQIAVKVRANRRAEVITTNGRITPTHITMFPFADKATNTFKVRLELPEGQFELYPGMFIKVAFVLGQSERLLIPSIALVQRSEVKGVYVLDNEQIRLRQVRIGNQFDDRVEVLSGLKPGEKIALNPVQAGIRAKSATAKNDVQ